MSADLPAPGPLALSSRARLVVVAVLALALLGAWAGRAAGQDGATGTEAGTESDSEPAPVDDGESAAPALMIGAYVTAVDARTDQVEIAVIGVAGGVDPSTVSLVVAGNVVEAEKVLSSRAVGRATELVVVVDTNVRSAPGDVLTLIKEELVSLVGELPASTSVAVISAGDSAVIATAATNDTEKAVAAIGELEAKNGSALFNAIDRAGTLFSDDPQVAKSLLIVSTGPDKGSDVTIDQALVSVVQKGVQIVAVDYRGGEPKLAAAVDETAGFALAVDAPDGIESAVARAMTVAADRLLVTFTEPDGLGARSSVIITVAEIETSFSYPRGVLTANSLQLAPMTQADGSEITFFTSSIGLYVAIGLAFIGISLGVWSLGSIMVGGDANLELMLARYTDATVEQSDGEVEELIVQSALLQRAVSFSESFAEKRGFLVRIEEMLERANLPIRAGEAIFILVAITVLATSFGLVITRSIVASVLLAVFASGISFFVVRFLGRRRFKAFEAQLPDTLQLLAGTLRAGYSLPQGLEAVSNEVADPMGSELRRAMTEARLGRDLEDCLDGVAERLSSADFAWAVMAIGIQREVGGNLNELLMSVADTMIARERLKREIAGLTAEGRVSAGVLSFLPPGLGLIMWVLNPEYVNLLFSEVLGNIMLGAGVVSALIGLAWMKKVITVDV